MRVLIVDDEKNIRRALAVALESMSHDVVCASNSALALAELRAKSFDVVLLDLRLSQESGLDVLEEILRVNPQAAVVMVTAYASVETAVEAMRRGAFDYLPKPCTPEQVRQVLARVEKTRKLERRVAELESQIATEGPQIDLTSDSTAMQKVLDVAFKAADSEATVLLLGESGTGKSVLARAMHHRSPRRAGAFVTVSCPSLSRELLESDLFGHVKGAFTGASCLYRRVKSRRRMAERFSSTRSENCRSRFRRSYCDCSRSVEYERVGDLHEAASRQRAGDLRDQP